MQRQQKQQQKSLLQWYVVYCILNKTKKGKGKQKTALTVGKKITSVLNVFYERKLTLSARNGQSQINLKLFFLGFWKKVGPVGLALMRRNKNCSGLQKKLLSLCKLFLQRFCNTESQKTLFGEKKAVPSLLMKNLCKTNHYSHCYLTQRLLTKNFEQEIKS
jgi:hypothetical protein